MATLRLPKKEKIPPPDVLARRTRQSIARAKRSAAATEWLIRQYPAFAKCLPLALGIHKHTNANRPKSISNNSLAMARKEWVSSPRYLMRLAEPGSQRHNLDGTVAGPVSDEHREIALKVLARG